LLMLAAAEKLAAEGIDAEVVDLRILNPIDRSTIADSVGRTGRLLAVDGGWSTCGLSAEILASAMEAVPFYKWKCTPKRITLPDAPAPSSRVLEAAYYPTLDDIVATLRTMLAKQTA